MPGTHTRISLGKTPLTGHTRSVVSSTANMQAGYTASPDSDAAMLRWDRKVCGSIQQSICNVIRSLRPADINFEGYHRTVPSAELNRHETVIEQRGSAADYAYVVDLQLDVFDAWDRALLDAVGLPGHLVFRDHNNSPCIACPPSSHIFLFCWDAPVLEMETSPQRSEQSQRALGAYHQRFANRLLYAMDCLAVQKAQRGQPEQDEEHYILDHVKGWILGEAQRLFDRSRWKPRRPFADAGRESAWRQANPEPGSAMSEQERLQIQELQMRSTIASFSAARNLGRLGGNWSSNPYR